MADLASKLIIDSKDIFKEYFRDRVEYKKGLQDMENSK
jgi:hypothetical protein